MTPKSIEAIYRDNCKMVYWAAYSVLKRESDAMDIAQSVFLRAIKNIDKLNTMEDGQVKAWLYRVAVNLCYDAGRRLKREIPAEELPEPNTDREYELPEASAISRDQRERVKRAIDALPDIPRDGDAALLFGAGLQDHSGHAGQHRGNGEIPDIPGKGKAL